MPFTVKDNVSSGIIVAALISQNISFLNKGQDTAYHFLCCTAHVQGETTEELCGTIQALASQLEELRVTVSSQHPVTCPLPIIPAGLKL